MDILKDELLRWLRLKLQSRYCKNKVERPNRKYHRGKRCQ